MDYDYEVTQYFLFLLNLCKDPGDVFPEDSQDCYVAKEWLEKLCTYRCESLKERRTRNIYLSHLCACLNESKLRGPFVNKPGPGRLKDDIDFEEAPSKCNLNQPQRVTSGEDRDVIEECLLKITSLDTDGSLKKIMCETPEAPRGTTYAAPCDDYEKRPVTKTRSRSTSPGIQNSFSLDKRFEKYSSYRNSFAAKPEEPAAKKNDWNQYHSKADPYAMQYKERANKKSRWDQYSSKDDDCVKQHENGIRKPQADRAKSEERSNSIKPPRFEAKYPEEETTKKNDWSQYTSKAANCEENISKEKRWKNQYSTTTKAYSKQDENDIRKLLIEHAKARECANSPTRPTTFRPEAKRSKEMPLQANDCEQYPTRTNPYTSQRSHWDQNNSKGECNREMQNENDMRKPPTECKPSTSSRAGTVQPNPEVCFPEKMPTKKNDWEQYSFETDPNAVQSFKKNRWDKNYTKPQTEYTQRRENVSPRAEYSSRAEATVQPVKMSRWDHLKQPFKTQRLYTSKPDSRTKLNEANSNPREYHFGTTQRQSNRPLEMHSKNDDCNQNWEQYPSKPHTGIKQNENDMRKSPAECAKSRESSNLRCTCVPPRPEVHNCCADQCPMKPFKNRGWNQHSCNPDTCTKQNANDMRKSPTDCANGRENLNVQTCHMKSRPQDNCPDKMLPKKKDLDKYINITKGPQLTGTIISEDCNYSGEKCSKEYRWDQHCSEPEPAMHAKNDIKRPQSRGKPMYTCPDDTNRWNQNSSKPETCEMQNENEITKAQSRGKPKCSCQDEVCSLQRETQQPTRPSICTQDKCVSKSKPNDVECVVQLECKKDTDMANTRYRMPRPFSELCEKYKVSGECYRPKAITCRQQVPVKPTTCVKPQEAPMQPQTRTYSTYSEDCGDTVSVRSIPHPVQDENNDGKSDGSRLEEQNENYEAMPQSQKTMDSAMGPFLVKNDNYLMPQSTRESLSSFSEKPRATRSKAKFTMGQFVATNNSNMGKPGLNVVQESYKDDPIKPINPIRRSRSSSQNEYQRMQPQTANQPKEITPFAVQNEIYKDLKKSQRRSYSDIPMDAPDQRDIEYTERTNQHKEITPFAVQNETYVEPRKSQRTSYSDIPRDAPDQCDIEYTERTNENKRTSTDSTDRIPGTNYNFKRLSEQVRRSAVPEVMVTNSRTNSLNDRASYIFKSMPDDRDKRAVSETVYKFEKMPLPACVVTTTVNDEIPSCDYEQQTTTNTTENCNNYTDKPTTSKQQAATNNDCTCQMDSGYVHKNVGFECLCNARRSSSEIASEDDQIIAVEKYNFQMNLTDPCPCDKPPTNCKQLEEDHQVLKDSENYTQPEEDPSHHVLKDSASDKGCHVHQNLRKSASSASASRVRESDSGCIPPTAPKSDASLYPRKTVSFCPSREQELLRDDIFDLLDSIACELRGDAEPGSSAYLESELNRYIEFINASSAEAASSIKREKSTTKLRSFLLLRLQNDLVKLLTEECI